MPMRRSLIGATLLALMMTGCAVGSDGRPETRQATPVEGRTAAKNVDGREMRTDLDPLTARFPALGEPVSARWMTGTRGDNRVPPTLYWIDGVVTLAPETAERLRAEHAPAPGGGRPDVVDQVAELVPDGELTRSDALDAALSHDEWQVRAWLVTDQDVLVLETKGR